jgi:hypothetical protein
MFAATSYQQHRAARRFRPSTALALVAAATASVLTFAPGRSPSSPQLATTARVQPVAMAQPLSDRLLASSTAQGLVRVAPPTAIALTPRLRRLGLVAGLTQQLHGLAPMQAVAVSVVERFHSPAGARSELAYQGRPLAGQTLERYHVPGIPGAVGWSVRYDHDATGMNVAFTTGSFYYLVGASVSRTGHGAPTRASLAAAAQFLYLSANGCVAPHAEAHLV